MLVSYANIANVLLFLKTWNVEIIPKLFGYRKAAISLNL